MDEIAQASSSLLGCCNHHHHIWILYEYEYGKVMWWIFPLLFFCTSPSKKKVVKSITPGTQLQDHLEFGK